MYIYIYMCVCVCVCVYIEEAILSFYLFICLLSHILPPPTRTFPHALCIMGSEALRPGLRGT